MKNKMKALLITAVTVLGMMGGSMSVMAATPDVVMEVKEKEVVPETQMGPITPDGNLTLVDDYGEVEETGKQFVTMVTKDGNYFYLIIDRDDEGKETVHFLNQVDDADLFALLEEEELEALEQEKTVLEEEVIIEEPVVEENRENMTSGYILFGGMIAASAAALLIGKKVIDKKKQEQLKEPEVDDEEEYYEFLDLDDEMNGAGLDDRNI